MHDNLKAGNPLPAIHRPITQQIVNEYANTSGGTIPILLDEVNKAGKLENGNIVLFAAVGSGWTYGASILKW